MSKLTSEQRHEIAHSNLTYDQLCKKHRVDKKTISAIKEEAGTKKGKSSNGGANNCKITPEQRQEIINSKLAPVELAKIYPLNPAYISRIQTGAGKGKGTGNYSREHLKVQFTYEQMELVKDLNFSAMQLERETGIPNEIISRRRKDLGLSYREFQKANKPPKKPVLRSMRKKSEPKPKVINAKVKKQLPVKIMKPKKEVAPIKESQFEHEQKQLAKAKKAKEDYREVERKKMADGYKYVTRVGRFGIKETVLIKQ